MLFSFLKKPGKALFFLALFLLLVGARCTGQLTDRLSTLKNDERRTPQHTEVTAPLQPAEGPGSSKYPFEGVKSTRYGEGDTEYWIFEPVTSTPPSLAPVIVFNHGWGAMNPGLYGAWIEHLVKRGNVVIYPRYQKDLRTSPSVFTDNALAAVNDAFTILKEGGHIKPDRAKFAMVGHSIGGMLVANMAARVKEFSLPTPSALMSIEPGKTWARVERINIPVADLAQIPGETLLLTVVGDADSIVKDIDAKRVFAETTQVPLENKDFITLISDNYGNPALFAGHGAPTAFSEQLDMPSTETTEDLTLREQIKERLKARIRDRISAQKEDVNESQDGEPLFEKEAATLNALDYYGLWKLFDGLTDSAFYGKNREYALGNTPQQRFMGTWSDGTPVKELVVTDIP